MDRHLNALSDKITRLIAQCESMREENHALRSRAASLESENQRLTERMEEARQRIETLIEHLPTE